MVPFAVNHLAQAAAVASLAAEQELLERVERVVAERTRVREALITQGWTVPESQANFVWLRLGDDTPAFAAACAVEGVAVRPFGTEGARVSDWGPRGQRRLPERRAGLQVTRFRSVETTSATPRR